MKNLGGYIWPVKKKWGLEVFKKASKYIEYGYSRPRRPKEDEILVFYYKKRLIGSIPVKKAAKSVDNAYRMKKKWKHKWKYMMGLSGEEKIEFDPPIPIDRVADTLRVLKGKAGNKLHNACRFSPRISPLEYLFLLEKAAPIYKSAAISYKLTPTENSEWIADLSSDLKGSDAPPEKVMQTYYVYRRNQKLIRTLKTHYKGACQICGYANKIQTDSGEFYSEGHHLVPLGENGYDSLSNVVILCPLCHKKLHYWKDREHLKGKITYSQEHIKTLKKLGFEEEANAS